MRCWMHLRPALPCALLALLLALPLAACGTGEEAAPLTQAPTHAPPAAAEPPPAPAPQADPAPPAAEPDGPAPRLLSAPGASQATLRPGETLQVWLEARGQRPLDSVAVTLRDALGASAGSTWLTALDDVTWGGLVPVAPDAVPGDYVMEVTLNDGDFASGADLHQALYQLDPRESLTHYRRFTNRIQVQGTLYRVEPLGNTVSAVPLAAVRVQAP